MAHGTGEGVGLPQAGHHVSKRTIQRAIQRARPAPNYGGYRHGRYRPHRRRRPRRSVGYGIRRGRRQGKQRARHAAARTRARRAQNARISALKTLSPGLRGNLVGLPGFRFSEQRRKARSARAETKLFGRGSAAPGVAPLPTPRAPKPYRLPPELAKLYRPKFERQLERHQQTATYYRARAERELERTRPKPPDHLKVGGLDLSLAVGHIADPFQRIAATVALALVHHPGKIAGTSKRTAVESITGIPQGIKMLVEDPKHAGGEIIKDYKRRYGPLLKGDEATFSKRLSNDYGVTPYLLDAAAAVGGSGTVAGKLSKVGALGRGAEKLMREPRPRLRISGGEAGTIEQPASHNLFVRAVQHKVDVGRAKKFRETALAHGADVGVDNTIKRIPGLAPARFEGLRPGPGEVLPYHSPRESKLLHRYVGRTERRHGKRKASERMRLLTVSGDAERRARKAIGQLDSNEKDTLVYAMQFGISHRDQPGAVRALERYKTMIHEGRKGEHSVLPFEPDELPTIQKIIDNPQAHLTPKLRQVADELRALEREHASKDPGLVREQAGARRILPQSMLLGERRRPDVAEFHGRLQQLEQKLRDQSKNPGDLVARFGHVGEHEPLQRQTVIRDLERATRIERGKAERALQTADRRAARLKGKVEGRNKPIRTPDVRNAERELSDAQTQLSRLERSKSAPEAEVRKARVREASARAYVREQYSAAPRASETLQRQARQAQEHVVARRAARDDARVQHEVSARLRKDLKHHPGRYENYDAWAKRVEHSAEEAGLTAPAYWESTTEPLGPIRSLKAVGTGIRGVARSREYTGARFLAGRQSGNPEVFVNGLLRNAKRRFSWRFAVNSMRQSAFEWSRGRHGGGLTSGELTREMDRRLIDPDTVEIVNIRTVEDRELSAEGLARGDVSHPEDLASPTGGIHPDDLRGVHEAIDASVVRKRAGATMEELQHDLSAGDVRGQAMNRYLAIPKRDYEELSAATRPDGVAGRGIDILLRQKPSRIILGLANTSWLSFQIMSNATMAGLGGALNPFDYVGAQRWWRTLTPEQKLAIEPELGITHHHHYIGDQTHLGDATNNRFVNAYRAFKTTKVMRNLHKGNPMDLMFRMDEAQNNLFRRTMLYTEARRDAYRRMGTTMQRVGPLQGSIMRVLEKESHAARVRGILDDAQAFERHAQHVNEWLGDYLTYSSAERRNFLLRSVMFYGWLRYSLRLVFWTMPVKHPIVSDILSNVGRMGSQEIKRLLGLPAEPDGYRNGDLPPWVLAQAYFGSAAEIQKEAPGSGTINFGRMNPFMNAVTQMERPTQAFGLWSPLFQMEMDQFLAQSTYRGKTWRINGLPTPGESERPANYFGSAFSQLDMSIPGVHSGSPRGRILERQLLELATPFRLWEQAKFRGTQADDALPWHPLPMQYKDPQAAANQRRIASRERGSLGRLGRTLFPQLGPVPTSSASVLKRELEKERAQRRRRRGGRRRKHQDPLDSVGGGGRDPLDSVGGGGDPLD